LFRKDGGKFLEELKEADRNFAPPAASNGLMNQIANEAEKIGRK
jgi:hypothetical protein